MGNKINGCRKVAATSSPPVPADKEISAQIARYLAIDCIGAVIAKMKTPSAENIRAGADTITATVGRIKKLPHDVAHRDARVADICKDLLGQVKEAISRKDFFERWGRHYLPSLRASISATMLQ